MATDPANAEVWPIVLCGGANVSVKNRFGESRQQNLLLKFSITASEMHQ